MHSSRLCATGCVGTTDLETSTKLRASLSTSDEVAPHRYDVLIATPIQEIVQVVHISLQDNPALSALLPSPDSLLGIKTVDGASQITTRAASEVRGPLVCGV